MNPPTTMPGRPWRAMLGAGPPLPAARSTPPSCGRGTVLSCFFLLSTMVVWLLLLVGVVGHDSLFFRVFARHRPLAFASSFLSIELCGRTFLEHPKKA